MRNGAHNLSLLLGVSLAIASCGGVQKAPKASSAQGEKTTRSMSADGAPAPASADSEGFESEYLNPTDQYKQEIAERFDEIREWRKDSGLSPEPLSIRPAPQVTLEKMREALGTLDPKSQECVDTCKISNDICLNADRICDIASDLGGDAWADEKCESATMACEEAAQQCEECINKELYGSLGEGHIEAPVWN